MMNNKHNRHLIYYFIVYACLITACALLIGISCGPKLSLEKATITCIPTDMQVEVRDRAMTVSFADNCERLKAGYNIYISRESLTDKYPGTELPVSIKPFNHPVFPGDTSPEDGIEHFEATGLENGNPYYVSVRIVFPDRTLSQPSREVVAVCGPRGDLELTVRYKSAHDGFSFIDNSVVRADNSRNDVYYFTKDGDDFLASPNRLDGFLRVTNLKVLPFAGTFKEVSTKLMTQDPLPDEDHVEVKQGDWVWLITADGYSALLEVVGFEGKGELRRIKLFYAFTPSRGIPIF